MVILRFCSSFLNRQTNQTVSDFWNVVVLGTPVLLQWLNLIENAVGYGHLCNDSRCPDK